MQIARTTPFEAPLPGLTPKPGSAPAPALDLIQRHGSSLLALGASDIEIVDATTVNVVFDNNFAGVQAAGALRDVVDGVKLLVANRSLTADYWEPTGSNTATWLRQSSIVENVIERETFPLQLDVVGKGQRGEFALGELLRTQLDDGTSVNVVHRMYTM